jgi:hypothetical protein
MTRRWRVGIMLLTAGGLVLVPTQQSAGAAAIQGDMSCTIGSAALSFTPSLVAVPRPRAKNSHVASPDTWILSGCTGPLGTPAPGGIDNAFVRADGAGYHFKAVVKAAACGNLAGMHPRIRIDWFNAAHDRVLGFTKLRMGTLTTAIHVAGPTDPETFVFAGTVPATQKNFRNKPVSFTLTTNVLRAHIAAACSSASLSNLSMQDGGSFKVGNPGP